MPRAEMIQIAVDQEPESVVAQEVEISKVSMYQEVM